VKRGGRLVLTFALALAFGWLLRHWHTPAWLSVLAIVAVWLVFGRYSWLEGGRDRVNGR
jgi:uncharacterized membrane protein AbrB (regulator of aidB expression)